MPKSRLRGGKKQHRKRVQKRNEKLKSDIKAIEHLKKQIIEEAKERHKQQELSGNTKWNIT